LTLAVVATTVFAGSSQAGAPAGELGILTPGTLAGNNPATGAPWEIGDTYRFVFHTSTTTTAESADIATYNAWVQGLADASTAYDIGADDGVTWKVIASTDDVNAIDNTSTTWTDESPGCPIYLLDGSTLIASSYKDLWDGEIQHIINLTEEGLEWAFWPFTGTYLDGTKAPGHATSFSALGGGSQIHQGNASVTTEWIWRTWTGDPPETELPMYALSDPLFIVGPPNAASRPKPRNGATEVSVTPTLTWSPGISADKHDVYLGVNFDDVNDAGRDNPLGVLVIQDQDPNIYARPGRLAFGETYYWRVDEVNAPPESTIFKGEVWSFSTEPVAYAVPPGSITATASSADADQGPENTVNEFGLDANDLHSDKLTEMWITAPDAEGQAWIQYQFDRVLKLHEMLVWNHNGPMESSLGLGCKDVTIEYSVDGNDFTTLGATHEFTRAPGSAGYAADTTIGFNGAVAKYVKLTISSNWKSLLQQYGLSEVRFFSIPVFAREPNPIPGATDVSVEATLDWRAGRDADQHIFYLSTDEQAVIDGTALIDTVSTSNYTPALELASTHYWRIDEVNEAEMPAVWQGEIWSFSTPEFLVVEDFESYNEIPFGEEGSNLVYNTWIDGYVDPPAVRTNGSTMGHTVAYEPSMETVTVYDGSQSAPLYYDNTTTTYSEITANVANLQVGPDWTKYGIKGLTLRFYGDPNNTAQQLYVKINGTKIPYDGDAENLKDAIWHMWYVDLTSLNVSNITTLTIGLERIGAIGGQGTILLDGIRLYSYDRDLVIPVDPDPAGLELKFDLDGNAADSSGKERNGTIVGDPVFEAGVLGQALTFDGVDDYITVDGYKGIVADMTDPDNPVQQPFTIACWFKTLDNGEMVTWGTNAGRQRMTFRIDGGRLRTEHGAGAQRGVTNTCNDGEWHHAAVVVNEGATITPPQTVLYLDGKAQDTVQTSGNPYELQPDVDVHIGHNGPRNDRFFPGSLDDVRLYSRTLTVEEVASLAGQTMPYDKPF
jgi:hypothetical protein